MFTNYRNALCLQPLSGKRWAMAGGLFLFFACTNLHAYAQGNFNSGSTGADGAFAPTTANTIVPLPDSGIFNFTTINVPSGVTVTFTRNAKNTPVTMLATGNVTIAGTIILDGGLPSFHGGGAGGPGGFNGGAGSYNISGFTSGTNGDGPGGGGGGRSSTHPNITPGSGGGGGYAVAGNTGYGGQSNIGGEGGPRYGTNTLLPLIGGSGGGGGGIGIGGICGAPGGGGGGAILIASSGTITFSSGKIYARGGKSEGSCETSGGGGSGGAIRLVANIIIGTVTLDVSGGSQSTGGIGASGFIRVEAFDINNLNPSVNPTFSLAQPKPAILPNAPQLRIASVAGVAAPASPTGSLAGLPDIVLPTAQTSPVNVVINGANLPVGTTVTVTLTPENGARASVNTTLAGTEASSSATASVTLPTAGLSVISATASIDLTLAKASPMFIDGERVDRIEVAATYGGASEVTYITRSGKRIKRVD